jgi:hypothetical protein
MSKSGGSFNTVPYNGAAGYIQKYLEQDFDYPKPLELGVLGKALVEVNQRFKACRVGVNAKGNLMIRNGNGHFVGWIDLADGTVHWADE